MQKCTDISFSPYFSPTLVYNKRWKIYYDWHMWLEYNCVEMVFSPVSHEIVTRIYNDMSEYLEDQPLWDAATMVMTLGNGGHEILLMADHQGPEGRFVGVLNVARDGRPQRTRPVPLMQFQMKLYEDRYLVMLDCYLGVGIISVEVNDVPPTKKEIDSLIETYKLGAGHHACTNYEPGFNYVTLESEPITFRSR